MNVSDIALSNSLADLAARIRAEHEGARTAVKRGTEHAITCGELLIEAKGQLEHGQWAQWLIEHCEMSGRTARLYMQLARKRAELVEAENGNVANLSVRGALALIAPAIGRPDPAVDPWAWAEVQVEEPFTDWDFQNVDWMQTKFLRCAGVPHSVAFACRVMKEYKLPILEACSAEELVEAMRLIAPYAKSEAGFELDSVKSPIDAWAAITVVAQSTYVVLYDELKGRQKRSEESQQKRAKKVLQSLSEACDAKLAKLADIRTRLQPDMSWDDPVVMELRELAG
jgi:Protein of unknown function (DUF3102)